MATLKRHPQREDRSQKEGDSPSVIEHYEKWLTTLPDEMRTKLERRYPGGFTHRDEANAIVLLAFRNGPIEDFHAGQPSDLLEHPELSRITDEEMKALMLSACRCMERLLREKAENPLRYFESIMGANFSYCGQWER